MEVAVSVRASTVTMDEVTFSNNVSKPDRYYNGYYYINDYSAGGGLWAISFNQAYQFDLTIDNSVFSGNSGADGAGLVIAQGINAVINDSQITDNTAFFGGGLFITAPGGGNTVAINRSTITGNSANRGGGLYSLSGGYANTVTLDQVTVDSNTSLFGGGGIQANGYPGALDNLTIRNSTISRNSVTQSGTVPVGYGGGINVVETNLVVDQSTVALNSAYQGGGGIFADYYSPSVNITRSTISGNTANTSMGAYPGTGGGVLALSPAVFGNHVLYNSIVADNVDLSPTGAAPDVDGVGATFDADHTFIGSATTSATINNVGGSTIGGGSAMLGALGNSGGLTETQVPMTGSPVIDTGSGTRAADQRGLAGVVGGVVDIGSVEVQAAGINLDFNNDGMYNCGDMDLLEAAIDGGVYNAAFDVNADLVLNSQDVFDWLIDAGELRFGAGNRFLPGDANLNGQVDGSDFGIWNANKFTNASNWCLGDFNQSGQVDGSDFGIWNANKFMMSAASRPSDNGGTVLAARSHDVTGRVTSREVGERRTAGPLAASDRELRTKTPQAPPAAIRVVADQEPVATVRQVSTSFDAVAPRTEKVAALPVAQFSAIRSMDQAVSRTSVGSSAIERVFAEFEADDLKS